MKVIPPIGYALWMLVLMPGLVPGIMAQTLQVRELPVGLLLEWPVSGDPEGCTYGISLQAEGSAPTEVTRLRTGHDTRDMLRFLLTELPSESISHIHLAVRGPDGTLIRRESVQPGTSAGRSLRIVAIHHPEGARRLVLEVECGKAQTALGLLQHMDRSDLRRDHWDLPSGMTTLDIDLAGLPAGTYFFFLEGRDVRHELTLRISDKGSVLAGPVE